MNPVIEIGGKPRNEGPLCAIEIYQAPEQTDDPERLGQYIDTLANGRFAEGWGRDKTAEDLMAWGKDHGFRLNPDEVRARITEVANHPADCQANRPCPDDYCDKEACGWPPKDLGGPWFDVGKVAAVSTITEDEIRSLPRAENPRLTIDLEPGNFISEYMAYASSRSDAYPEYHYAAALFMVSTAIERRVVLHLKQGTVIPNLWIFCLGDSTISRKTTALREPAAILDTYDPARKLPGSFSPEAMIEALADSPQAYLLKDEAGSLLAAMGKKYMEETRDFFSEIYDGGDYYRKLRTGQRREKREFHIMKPYVTQLLATTPSNFREYTSLIDLTSGWLLRYIYLHPNHSKPWKPFEPAGEDDFSRCMAISTKYGRLREMLGSLETEEVKLTLPPVGWEFFAAWQRGIEEQAMADEDNLTKAVAGRLMTVALKTAVIFTVAREDFDPNRTREISMQHIKEAARQVESYFLPMALQVAEDVARSEKENLQNRIIGTIKRAGGMIRRRDLLRKLHVKLQDVDAALDGLAESEEVETLTTTGKGGERVVYRLSVSNVPIVPSVSSVSSVPLIQDNPSCQSVSEHDRLSGIEDTDVTKETDVTGGTEGPDLQQVRFLSGVGRFTGVDGHIYGPFRADDVAAMPSIHAKNLVQRGAACPINPDPGLESFRAKVAADQEKHCYRCATLLKSIGGRQDPTTLRWFCMPCWQEENPQTREEVTA